MAGNPTNLKDTLKLQPQNIEAEKAVIGAILLDKDAIIKVAELLQPGYFYDEKHRIIYKAIVQLYEARSPVDIVTLPDALKRKNDLEKVGGVAYITSLLNETPSAQNVESHAQLVRDAFIRRKLITTSAELSELGFDQNEDVEDILDLAEQKLFSISQQNLKGEFVPIRKTLEESFELLDELYQNKDGLRGIPTGFPTLDSKLNGFRKGNLVILASRPSVGKSSFLSNVIQHAAVHQKTPIGLFSLEMSSGEVAIRMIATEGNIDSFKITSGRLNDDEMAAYGEASGILADAPIFIDDTASISIMELRTKARRLHADAGLQMLVVDYLQLMRGRNLENRVQEVSEISWGLKALAKELDIPVIAAAQLNRSVEQRGTGIPMLSDLRESGSIEQDADVVMFLYRPDDENKNEIMLTIAKHRNGPTGYVPLFFRPERTKFYEQSGKKE